MPATPEDPFVLMERIAAKRKKKAAPAPERPATVRPIRTADPGNTYGQTALAAEVQRVMDATEGSRNHALNRAAFSLGQLVAGGVLDEQAVRDALLMAARAVGLDDVEAGRTINSGFKGGQDSPRGVPEEINDDVKTWLDSLPRAAVDPATGDVVAVDADTALRQYVREHLPVLNWHDLWADQSEEEWIVEPLLPARRLVALYSAPKVGKSLLLLELCVAIATGRDVLGVSIDRPRRVLYIDFENDPKADIRERLQNMGVGPDDLTHLHYLSFPTLAALDSERGGVELMAAVAEYGCEVVVVDTVSRSIQGEENENDTWLAFYRHTGLKMKQAGVALIRLDHSGKDESKGQRGGSAKSGDVDAVWRMSKVTDDTYRLDCEAARMPIVEKTLVLHREDYPLRHRVDAEGRSAVMEVVKDKARELLDNAGLAHDAGRDKARPILKQAGLKIGNTPLAEVLATRKARGPQPVRTCPEGSGQVPSDDLSRTGRGQVRTGAPE